MLTEPMRVFDITSKDDEDSYMKRFRVMTSEKYASPSDVVRHSKLPAIGSPWKTGTTDKLASCKTVTAKSPTTWEVTVEYSEPVGGTC